MEVAAPDFVLVLGDGMRHNADQLPDPLAASLETQQNLTAMLTYAFPDTPLHAHAIAETIGNNDVVPDYTLPLERNSSALQRFVLAWLDTLDASNVATVQQVGFYVREMLPGLRIVALNTLPYSVNHMPSNASDPDPFGQFAWLDSVLAAARLDGAAVYLVGHIPPIVDSYARKSDWVETYAATYTAIVRQYDDVVAAQLFGHLHADQFRVFPQARAPILLNPAVSPIYGNAPSFRVMQFRNDTKELEDMCTYVLDLDGGVWSLEYCMRAYTGVPSLSNAALRSLADRMRTNASVLAQMLRIYNGNTANAIPDYSQANWACLYGTVTAAQFSACLSASPWSLPLIVAIAAVGLAAVLVVGLVLWRRCRAGRFAYDTLRQDGDPLLDDNDVTPRLNLRTTNFA